jgi:hypothetical protein
MDHPTSPQSGDDTLLPQASPAEEGSAAQPATEGAVTAQPHPKTPASSVSEGSEQNSGHSGIQPGLPVRDADPDDHISVQSFSSDEQELDHLTSRGPPSETQLGVTNGEQDNNSFSSTSTVPFPEAAAADGSAPRAQAPSQDLMAAMMQLLQASMAQQLKTFADEQATARAQSQAQLTEAIDGLRSEVTATLSEREPEKATAVSTSTTSPEAGTVSRLTPLSERGSRANGLPLGVSEPSTHPSTPLEHDSRVSGVESQVGRRPEQMGTDVLGRDCPTSLTSQMACAVVVGASSELYPPGSGVIQGSTKDTSTQPQLIVLYGGNRKHGRTELTKGTMAYLSGGGEHVIS